MDKNVKKTAIDNLISIGYFWISFPNHLMAHSIWSMLDQVELDKASKKKTDDFYHDWKTIFTDKQNEKPADIVIPEEYCLDEDKKMLWIMSQAIMNLISTGNFELAYMNLLEVGMEWHELYANVIGMIRKTEFCQPFSEWLVNHIYVAFDINGGEEMEMAGYRIQKI